MIKREVSLISTYTSVYQCNSDILRKFMTGGRLKSAGLAHVKI